MVLAVKQYVLENEVEYHMHSNQGDNSMNLVFIDRHVSMQ